MLVESGPKKFKTKAERLEEAKRLKEIKSGFSIGQEALNHQTHVRCLRNFDTSIRVQVREQASKLDDDKRHVSSPPYAIPLSSAENPAPQKTDVLFDANYSSSKGALNIDTELFDVSVPRSVASNYEIDDTLSDELSKGLYVAERTAEFMTRNTIERVMGRLWSPTDELVGEVKGDVKAALKDADYQIANKDLPTLCKDVILKRLGSRTDVSAEKLEKIRNSLEKLSKCPIQVQSYSDHCGVPGAGSLSGDGFSSAGVQTKWQAVDDDLLNQNLLLTMHEADFVKERFGVQSNCSIYYDSRYWSYGTGLGILLDQASIHAKTIDGVFLSPSPDPRYSVLPVDTYVDNMKSASGRYNNGADYRPSVQKVKDELDGIHSDLQKLYSQTIESAGADLSEKGIDAAFARLYSSDSAFRSGLDDAHKRLLSFQVKYATARRYGPGGDEYSAKSVAPMAIVKNVFGSSDALPAGEAAGYMAADYAMNYIGRGITISLPANLTLQKADYVVDQKTSKVAMGINSNPNSGEASVLVQVRMDKAKSIVEEDPDQMSQDIRRALEPALAEQGARIDPRSGVRFSDDGQYRIYSVPVLKDFTITSREQVKSLHLIIQVPTTFYSTGDERLTVLDLSARVSDVGDPNYVPPTVVPSNFRFGLSGGLSTTWLSGTTKQLGKGGTINNWNSPKEDPIGERNQSAGGNLDFYSMVGYNPMKDLLHCYFGTYWSDRHQRPEYWLGRGLFDADASPLIAAYRAGQYASTDLFKSAALGIFEQNVDSYVKNGYTANLFDELSAHPYMKDKPKDFLDSLGKIREWSPMHADLSRWSLYQGFLLSLKIGLDPKVPEQQKLLNVIDDEIKYAKARYISTPVNALAPDYLSGVAMLGDIYESLMRINQAAREQGLSAIFFFDEPVAGRESRLRLTFSRGIGPKDENYFSQVITHPGASMALKVNNGTMLMLDYMVNLYKSKGDKSVFRFDFYAEINLNFAQNFKKYEYNSAVQQAFSRANTAQPMGVYDLFLEHHQDPDNLNFYALSQAAQTLKDNLGADDVDGRTMCNRLIALCDVNNPDVSNRGKQVSDLITSDSGLREHILSPMYLGGETSDTEAVEGNYVNGLAQYVGRDYLPIGTPVPLPVLGVTFHFEEDKSSLGGLLPQLGVDPQSAALRLDIRGMLCAPGALTALLASPFVPNGSVAAQAMDQSAQLFRNPIPPLLFQIQLDRAFEVSANYGLQTGLYLAGDASAFRLSHVGVSVEQDVRVPGLNTLVSLNTTGSFSGLAIGRLAPSAQASLSTYTQITKNLNVGTVLYGMIRDDPFGTTFAPGFNLQFQYVFGGKSAPAINDPYAKINLDNRPQIERKLFGGPKPSDGREENP
ncbi:MAG: hypothetical protein V1728_04330 [Candidatus Micrarchaeota archaeon]